MDKNVHIRVIRNTGYVIISKEIMVDNQKCKIYKISMFCVLLFSARMQKLHRLYTIYHVAVFISYLQLIISNIYCSKFIGIIMEKGNREVAVNIVKRVSLSFLIVCIRIALMLASAHNN